MKRILLLPDGADGGAPITAAAHNAPQLGVSEPVNTPPPGAGPVATTVVTGTKSEREIELEREADELREQVKDRERTICEVQDKHENYRRTIDQQPPKKKKVGVGFFETDDDDDDTAQ